jgi:hypothetical protein
VVLMDMVFPLLSRTAIVMQGMTKHYRRHY